MLTSIDELLIFKQMFQFFGSVPWLVCLMLYLGLLLFPDSRWSHDCRPRCPALSLQLRYWSQPHQLVGVQQGACLELRRAFKESLKIESKSPGSAKNDLRLLRRDNWTGASSIGRSLTNLCSSTPLCFVEIKSFIKASSLFIKFWPPNLDYIDNKCNKVLEFKNLLVAFKHELFLDRVCRLSFLR